MFVGRDQELHQLRQLIEDARSGISGVLAIVGEVGIGKSALLSEAADLGAGMTILRARGVQSETCVPFGGLFELCRPILDGIDKLPAPQRSALGSALALSPAHRGDRFLVGAATLNLLATAAETQPVLVLVDDAQWVDGSTGDALRFALRRLLADRVAAVIASRRGDASFIDESDFSILRLEGLDTDSAQSLIEHHSSGRASEGFVDRLIRGTSGNPLALVELAADTAWFDECAPADAPLPIAKQIVRVYSERIRILPPSTTTALLVAACNDSADLGEFARAAGSFGVTADDLAAAESARLITVGEGKVEFSHPLARSAVYGEAPVSRRREVHRALADVLPDAEFDRRAWHSALARVGPDEAVCSVLEQAAGHARERSAYDVASRGFERASSFAMGDERKGRLLLAAAESAWLAGKSERAVALVDQASVHAPDTRLRVAVEELRGYIVFRLGPPREAQTIFAACAELVAGNDPEHAVVMYAEAVNAAFYAGDPAAMRRMGERVVEIARGSKSGQARFLALMAEGMGRIFSDGAEDGVALVRSAVDMLLAGDELPEDPRLLVWAAMGPLWLRESGGAYRGLIDRASEVARDRSEAGVLPFTLGHVAIDQAATNQWTRAEAAFQEAIELASESRQETDLATLLSGLAWIEARLGAEARCREHAAEALRLARAKGIGLCEIWALRALGDLELGLGNAAQALTILDERARLLADRGIGDPDLSPTPELVEVNLRLGHLDQAAALAGVAYGEAGRKGRPWVLARAERCRGLVADESSFDIRFKEALALHESTPDVFETARTRLAYGARLRRERRRMEAREHLRPAIAEFDQLGSLLWGDVARAELAATGETARRRSSGSIGELTPQELQIAGLLASGRTTREAAAAVFLSPKTVEYHLRSVYRKLGINSRSELLTALEGDQ